MPPPQPPQSEDQLQAQCYKWLYNTYPALRGLFFSVPNGSTRHPLEALKLKATGLTPGIPDCILIKPGPYGFEFKTDIGRLSDAQSKVHAIWEAAGVTVFIIRSFEQFHGIVVELMAGI